MSAQVGVSPKNETAAKWLEENFEALRKTFVLIHRALPSSISGHHPHDIYMSHPGDDKWSPPLPSVIVIAEAHWNKAHADVTVADIREALRRVGANLDDFEIENTWEEANRY